MCLAVLAPDARLVQLANLQAVPTPSQARLKPEGISRVWVQVVCRKGLSRAARPQRSPRCPGGAVSRPGAHRPGYLLLSPDLSSCLIPHRLRQEKTDTVRCIKSCRPGNMACVRDPVHTISHTVISLPTFREFSRPEGERTGMGPRGPPSA